MRNTRSRFAAAQSEHTSSLRSWAMGNVIGMVHRSWLVFGVAVVVAGALVFHWNRSAADETSADAEADVTLAQAVKSQRAGADKPVAERPAAHPTAYSLFANENDERI